MKKIGLVIVLLLTVFTFFYYFKHPLGTRATIHGHEFAIELAVTPQEKSKGLGYRNSLPENTGMLFPYDHKERYQFWMKGMRFPLDIVWILDNNIVDIAKNVPVSVNGYLPEYMPSVAVNKVLELNAGTMDEIGAKVGDIVKISN